MTPQKFDQEKVKHQLLHVSISLATILVIMIYLQNITNWSKIGKLWELNFIILGGCIMNLILAKRQEKDLTLETGQMKYNKHKSNKRFGMSFKEITIGLIFQLICSILYAFTCIILGAPLWDYDQSFLLASILTLLTVTPTVLLIGVSGALQACFCEKADITKAEETVLHLNKNQLIGTILGAWSASVVAPLDWDAEWQRYPIPNIIGALLGASFGHIYSCSRVLYQTAKVFLKKRS